MHLGLERASDAGSQDEAGLSSMMPLLDGPGLFAHLPADREEHAGIPADAQAPMTTSVSVDPLHEMSVMRDAVRLVNSVITSGHALIPAEDLASDTHDDSTSTPVASLREQRTRVAQAARQKSPKTTTSGVQFGTPTHRVKKRSRVHFEGAGQQTPAPASGHTRHRVRCEPVDSQGCITSRDSRLVRWMWPDLPRAIRRLAASREQSSSSSSSASGYVTEQASGSDPLDKPEPAIPTVVSPADAVSLALQALMLRCEWYAAAQLASRTLAATDAFNSVLQYSPARCISIAREVSVVECNADECARMLETGSAKVRRTCLAVLVACLGQLSKQESESSGAVLAISSAAHQLAIAGLRGAAGAPSKSPASVGAAHAVATYRLACGLPSLALPFYEQEQGRVTGAAISLLFSLSLTRCLSAAGCHD